MAELQGRTTIRPWRVGVLVDTSSAHAVREIIADLSSVWGGKYMPIIDINIPIEEVERLGEQYDVDCLYADAKEGLLSELLSRPGWKWGYRGPWGPFREEHGFRRGLLAVSSLIDTATNFIQPIWGADHPADLIMAATWGLDERLDLPLARDLVSDGPRTASHSSLLQNPPSSGAMIGTLEAGSLYVRPNPREYLRDFTGLYIIRPGHLEDVIEFWNRRIYGSPLIGIPADEAEGLLHLILRSTLPSSTHPKVGGTESTQSVVRVWGWEDTSSETSQAIRAAADRDGVRVQPVNRSDWPNFYFQGLRSSFTRSIRVSCRPEARGFDAPLPPVLLKGESNAYMRGVVAAEIHLHSVSGLDPRLTAFEPPYRRHSALLEHSGAMQGIDHVRASQEGVVLGFDADDRDQVRVPFAYNLDVMRLLFDDESVSVKQSDVGKFQSRAAEMLGGPFSGVFNQPGVRAAISVAAGKDAGVALPHLRQEVEHHRGNWPDPLFGPRVTPKEYADRELNHLLHSRLFVPLSKVHCSHCRVETYISADALAANAVCEFCGQRTISHSRTLWLDQSGGTDSQHTSGSTKSKRFSPPWPPRPSCASCDMSKNHLYRTSWGLNWRLMGGQSRLMWRPTCPTATGQPSSEKLKPLIE